MKLTRTSRWDGTALVTEIEIEDGPRIERRYELSPGGAELRVSTTTRGGRGGAAPPVTLLYERPLER